jgi:hypothetical protein
MAPNTLYVLACIFVPYFAVLSCAGYAYAVNRRRSEDDPKKQEYHPWAILLVPITFPIFLTLGFFVFVLRAILFAVFLVVFSVLLVALRKPFLFIWWDKFATRIGEPLLKANTYLIKMAFGPGKARPQPQPL